MHESLKLKLSQLPTSPGIYFHKNTVGEIIYIGKAANLRNRVRQYFQTSRYRDPKTDVLVSEITDVEWTPLESEADALFVEAELVRRYQPPYNIMLRDDKSLQYIRIDYKSDYPTVSLIRRPLDDDAQYFGPYLKGGAIKRALRYLRRAFPYATAQSHGQKRASLHYHLGLDPGLEDGRTSLANYKANLRKLMRYLRGERVALIRGIESDMKKAAASKDFEKAAALRNQLFALQELNRQILFSDRELLDASRDHALTELTNLLSLYEDNGAGSLRVLRCIEGFDVSHMQGSDTVASMVVFSNGIPNKTAYRKFKMRLPGNDDFGHLHEALIRRLREENVQKWGTPDLIMIDGGKGQLAAGIKARDQSGLTKLPIIGLAKRQEEIIIHKTASLPGVDAGLVSERAKAAGAYVAETKEFLSLLLPPESHVVKLLQRIRDESHRFAVAYHSTLKRGRQKSSLLDEIPGIGPATRRLLIRHFGSARGVLAASENELQQLLGERRGSTLTRYLASYR